MIRCSDLTLLFCLFLVAFPVKAWAIDGTQWQHLPESAKFHYVMGVIDTWEGVLGMADYTEKGQPKPELSVVDSVIKDNVECIDKRNMRKGQVVAIVKKHMEDNPRNWDHPMPDLVFEALAQACK